MECKWRTDGDCEGTVIRIDLFPGQSVEDEIVHGESVHDMPVCCKHLVDHFRILVLSAVDVDKEEILAMDGEQRKLKIAEMETELDQKGNK